MPFSKIRMSFVLVPGIFFIFLFGRLPLAHATQSQEKFVSAQLHVHGSLSEHTGSMDSETHNAAMAGVDVVWWSDHEHLVNQYHRSEHHGFEDPDEEDGGLKEAWVPGPIMKNYGKRRLKPNFTFIRNYPFTVIDYKHTSEKVYAGKKSFRVKAKHLPEKYNNVLFRLISRPKKFKDFKRSLASEVEIQLALYPKTVSDNATALIDIKLSNHRPVLDEIHHKTSYRLRYYLNNQDAPYRDKEIYFVPLKYKEDEWNVVRLDVTGDAVKGFPFIDGLDNSTNKIYVGARTRKGGRSGNLF